MTRREFITLLGGAATGAKRTCRERWERVDLTKMIRTGRKAPILRRDHCRQGAEPNRSARKSRNTLTLGKRWRPGT